MSFFSNLADGYKDAANLFSEAGDRFKSGNVAGALGMGFNATLTGLGNILTLGGAHYFGEKGSEAVENGDTAQHDGILDGAKDCALNVADWFVRNDAESALQQSDLADGTLNVYKFNKEKHCYEIDKNADGSLKSGEIDKTTGLIYANAMGLIDVAGYAVDLVTVGTGSGVFKTAAKTGAKKAITEGVEEAVEQGAKVAAKEGVEQLTKKAAKEAASTLVEESAKNTVKTLTKEGVEAVAEEGAEQLTKKAAKEAASTLAEESAKNTVKTLTKESAENVAKNGVKDLTKKTLKEQFKEVGKRVVTKQTNKLSYLKSGFKHLATSPKKGVSELAVGTLEAGVKSTVKLGAYGLKDRILNGTTVVALGSLKDENGDTKLASSAGEYAEAAKENAGDVATDYAKDTGSMIRNAAKDLYNGAKNGLLYDWLKKHPVLARVYRTVNSAAYATAATFGDSKPVAYASAVCMKASDKIVSWATNSSGKYTGMSISQVANKVMSDKAGNDNSWKQNYAERAAELTELLEIHDTTSDPEYA